MDTQIQGGGPADGSSRYAARVTRYLLPATLGLVLLALGVRIVQQGARIDALAVELAALHAPAAAVELRTVTPPRAPNLAPALPRPTAPAIPVEPRVAVSPQEVARVESAVLSLLEADRPELREKLRAVVQEQQETAERARQEQRRERWVTRTEARLSELTGASALSETERQNVVAILLGTRDQIAELRQGADTPERILEAREAGRRLRDEAKVQIRQLLGSARYQAYELVMNRGDDEDERGPPRSPGR